MHIDADPHRLHIRRVIDQRRILLRSPTKGIEPVRVPEPLQSGIFLHTETLHLLVETRPERLWNNRIGSRRTPVPRLHPLSDDTPTERQPITILLRIGIEMIRELPRLSIVRPPVHTVPVKQYVIRLVEPPIASVFHEDRHLLHLCSSRSRHGPGQSPSSAIVHPHRPRIHLAQSNPCFEKIRTRHPNHPIVQNLDLHPHPRSKSACNHRLLSPPSPAPRPCSLVIDHDPPIECFLSLRILNSEF